MPPFDTAGLDVFYPIVPDAQWMARIAPLGVRTVQLRLKDASSEEVRSQVRDCIGIAKRHGCQLIINDYWQTAIEERASYIHLGQEDLAAADLAAIRAAGIRLGISTHDEAELETALWASPDYIALGPIYETKLKAMKWAPQGLARITRWRARIGSLPLVAIGGITPDLAGGVLAAGASSVAVITDYITSADPDQRIKTWLAWARPEH